VVTLDPEDGEHSGTVKMKPDGFRAVPKLPLHQLAEWRRRFSITLKRRPQPEHVYRGLDLLWNVLR
jgi:hypothetical protein